MRVLDLTAAPAGMFATHLLALLGHAVTRLSPATGARDEREHVTYHRRKALASSVGTPDGFDAVVADTAGVLDNAFTGDLVDGLRGRGDGPLLVVVHDVEGSRRTTGFVLDHAIGRSDELPAGDPYRGYDGEPWTMPGASTLHDVGVQVASAVFAWEGHSVTVDISAARCAMTTHRYAIDFPDAEPEIIETRDLRLVFPFAGVLACSDGWVEVALLTDTTWKKVAAWLNGPAWGVDPAFPGKEFLDEHAEEVQQALRDWFRARTVAEVVDLGSRDAVPVAHYKDVTDVVASEHYLESGFAERAGDVYAPAVPYTRRQPQVTEPRASTRDASGPPEAPLAGKRIVDFTIAQAGAHASWTLAQLGADVIKVEHRDKPDIARLWSPGNLDTSFAYLEPNAGKRGLSVRWDTEAGRKVMDDLIRGADAFVSNVRPETLERSGFTYDYVTAVNPSIAYVTISAEGIDPDHYKRPGWAPNFAAASGLGAAIARDGHPPVEISQWADYAVGNMCALASLYALREAALTGSAVGIDVSAAGHLTLLASDTAVERQMGGVKAPCRRLLQCRDGDVACEFPGPGEGKLPALDTAAMSADEVIARLEEAGFAAAKRAGIVDVYFGGNGLGIDAFTHLDHHELLGKERKCVRNPWSIADSVVGSTADAPWLGQHSFEVGTRLLGWPAEAVERLMKDGVLG